jgi:hypothetical protein
MKGLASKETLRIVASATTEDLPKVPIKFWCDNSVSKSEHCCFWHYTFYPKGGPERDGIYHPVYEYEQELLKSLDEHKCVAVYKATGLGITEFMLLWTIWKCFTDSFFYGKVACIITGPNVDLAQDLILRTKDFLIKKGLQYVDRGAYELEINGARVQCYPSNNIHSARGIPRVSLFFGDESAFFKLKDDSIVRTVGERYIGKSNSWVVWVSTAGETPSGFFYDIMGEQDTIYKRHHFYVEAGLKTDPITNTSIFSPKYIAEASKARSFEREYLGVWGKNTGDIFSPEKLEEITSKEYTWSENDETNERIIGCDPGFGSSEFGICIIQKRKGKKSVIFAESYQRASYIDMVDKINALSSRFKTKKVIVDSAVPEIIKDLRDKCHLNVTGISFGSHGEAMLNYAVNHVDNLNVEIHPMFKKLKHQLMTIKVNSKGLPNKDRQNPFDLGDAFLLALYYYKMGSGVIAGIG